MVEGTLVDSVGSMKIILWEEFANAVVVGDTYIFKNIRVKKDRMTSEVYVNTAKNGTIITPSDAFNTPLYTPLEQQKNYGNSNFVGKIIGVEKVASYQQQLIDIVYFTGNLLILFWIIQLYAIKCCFGENITCCFVMLHAFIMWEM